MRMPPMPSSLSSIWAPTERKVIGAGRSEKGEAIGAGKSEKEEARRERR
jgi:hypothetical protein